VNIIGIETGDGKFIRLDIRRKFPQKIEKTTGKCIQRRGGVRSKIANISALFGLFEVDE
jgi:hypothetical protein